MRLLVIHNPNAGHGRAARSLVGLEAEAKRLGLDVELEHTLRPGHARELARQADLSRFDGLIAAGGDGTVFEVINGYLRNPKRDRAPFGVLPVGTGNAFARDLDLRTGQVSEALRLIASGNTRGVDVGSFATGGDEVYFLNILGVGFVSDVTATATRLKFLGSAAYTIGVVYRTVFLGSFRLTLELGEQTITRDATFLEISNSRYTADFLMAPNARIDDGLLDVTLLGKITRRRLLRFFPTVFRGEHIHLDGVETFSTSSLRITTDRPQILTPDGELVGSTPTEVRCLKRAIQVFG